jgi:hypothetical protein
MRRNEPQNWTFAGESSGIQNPYASSLGAPAKIGWIRRLFDRVGISEFEGELRRVLQAHAIRNYMISVSGRQFLDVGWQLEKKFIYTN